MRLAYPTPCRVCNRPLRPRSAGRGGPGAGHSARGLCHNCWKQAKADGDLPDHPRTHRPMAEVISDFNVLRLRQMTVRKAADHMGMTYAALDRAISRARKAGLHIVELPRT